MIQVSLTLIGQPGLGHFFRYRHLVLRQRRRKMTNTAPTNLNAIQVARQPTFINAQLYSTCDQQEGQK